jgi:dihydrofolate reductase
MGRVTYGMLVTLDGYIDGPGGDISWHMPDDELHTFIAEQERATAAYVIGRRTYETMSYWDHPEDGISDAELEFTAVWQRTPKLVLSRTLTSVGPNARLAGPDLAAEVTALRDAHEGNIGVSGTQAAAALVALDLIDAYQLYVHPVLLGAGTPMFPATDGVPRTLRLTETRALASGIVYLNYERA